MREALDHFGLGPKDATMISMGGIPEILAGMRAGAVDAGILSPPTSTAARDLRYRPLLHIPDLGKGVHILRHRGETFLCAKST